MAESTLKSLIPAARAFPIAPTIPVNDSLTLTFSSFSVPGFLMSPPNSIPRIITNGSASTYSVFSAAALLFSAAAFVSAVRFAEAKGIAQGIKRQALSTAQIIFFMFFPPLKPLGGFLFISFLILAHCSMKIKMLYLNFYFYLFRYFSVLFY